MKLFTSKKIKEWELQTCHKQNISEIDLVNLAATEFVKWFLEKSNHQNILIIAGSGNNGSDAISIFSKLKSQRNVNLLLFNYPEVSDIQKTLLSYTTLENIHQLSVENLMHMLPNVDCVIDGLFGSGLNRQLEDELIKIIQVVNASEKPVFSIDLPSGCYPEGNRSRESIKAKYTLSFQQPKVSFFLPESGDYAGHWDVCDIQLDAAYYEETTADYVFVDHPFIKKIYQNRSVFSHKGIFGKVLVIAGSRSMPGAMILSCGGALYSGAGKIYSSIEYLHSDHLSNHFPEIIQLMREDERDLNPEFLNQFDSICIGPGLGKSDAVRSILDDVLKNFTGKLVLDADSLNILAEKKNPNQYLNKNVILTPHPGEFQTLFGASNSRLEMIEKGQSVVQDTGCTILLKGAYSVILSPKLAPVFNSTGNVSLAQGGSGDVLCGLIGGLCAQGYDTTDATILGTYLHGLAADLDEERILSQRGRAYDLLHYLPSAFVFLRSSLDGFGSV